jgi:hypothetical protein
LFLQVIDPARSLGVLSHHSGIFQQAQVARDGGAADGHRGSDFLDGLVPAAEKAQNLAPICIA